MNTHVYVQDGDKGPKRRVGLLHVFIGAPVEENIQSFEFDIGRTSPIEGIQTILHK